jgi:hypothetical protein
MDRDKLFLEDSEHTGVSDAPAETAAQRESDANARNGGSTVISNER